jgi:hypothetical protein
MMEYSFKELIKRVDAVESSVIPDEIKLKRLGALIYQGSLNLLAQAESILENTRYSEVEQGDTKIDRRFSQFLLSLTQQSVSTNFLNKYLRPTPKAKYEREATLKIQSLTASEALSEFEQDLIEEEVMVSSNISAVRSQVISLAHDENIKRWIALVNECFEANSSPVSLSVPQIIQATSLSIAQVFISLLFGEFSLKQNGSFYEGDSIQVQKSFKCFT